MGTEQPEELDEWEAARIGGYNRERWNELVGLLPELADTPVERRWDELVLAFGDDPGYPTPEPEPKPVRYHKWKRAPNARGDWWGNTGFFRCEQCGKEERGTPQWAFSGESWYEIPGTDEPCQ